MKTITAAQFEQDFEIIIDDVSENKTTYKIIVSTLEDTEEKAVMLIPYEEYEYLQDLYTDWLKSEDKLKSNQESMP